jgi:hypothetical protein
MQSNFGKEKTIFGEHAICGGKEACIILRKNNMHKRKEKQHAEDGGKAVWSACRKNYQC